MARSSGSRADSPISTSIEVDDYDEQHNDKEDPKRRSSNITATSISSFPDSAWPSDSDVPGPYYSNAKPRPAYRVGSLRRSPLSERLSPSPLRPPKHTYHRPRSRGEDGRSRNRREDDARHETLQDTQPAPLVLLHVTVLPPRLPWNRTVLDAALPPDLKRQFGVLRAATTGLVAQRGILIAHPREEFELLEESVLEALDLLPERIGYDGQYRPRTPSTVVEGEAEDEEEIEARICDICQRVHVGHAWYTRVFAANGLMRAGAWSAAWCEMERVDVEVRPCIPEHICRKLDEMQSAEDIAKARGRHDPAIQPMHQIQMTQTPKQQTQIRLMEPTQEPTAVLTEKQHSLEKQSKSSAASFHNDLPPIYQPKDVPLRLLLRNYIYLVLRDRRNLAILFLALTLLASTFYGMLASQEPAFNRTSLMASRFQAVREVSVPPVSLPQTDVGHGKRHPMWTNGQIRLQDDAEDQELSLPDEMSTSDQDTQHISRSLAKDPTTQDTTVPTPSMAATTLRVHAEPARPPLQTSTFSANPAFLSLLHNIIQYCPNDQKSQTQE